jgi:hypothetical protein
MNTSSSIMLNLLSITCVVVGNALVHQGKPASGFALSTLGMAILAGAHWFHARRQ